MGLDMYLSASVYVSGYRHARRNEREKFQAIARAAGLDGIVDPHSPSGHVEVTCAHWRKANHIHAWFVNNVQDGEDECRPHDVSVEQLRELRDLCKELLDELELVDGMVTVSQTLGEGGQWVPNREPGKVVRNPEVALEKLPPVQGFFFGGTDIDQWYVDDLETTVRQLDRVLAWHKALPEDVWVSFKYQSSW